MMPLELNLTLSPAVEAEIAEQVRSGRFPTPEAGVEAAVAGLLAQPIGSSLDADDVAALNEGEAQIDRGEGMDLDALRATMAELFAGT